MEGESHLMIAPPTSHFIDASEVQPGQWIHYPGWSATTGDYEVLRVEPSSKGTMVTVWMDKVTRDEGFEARLFYGAGKTVEIVER